MELRGALLFLIVLMLFSGLSASAPLLDSWHEGDIYGDGEVTDRDVRIYPDYWSGVGDVYESYNRDLKRDYNCDGEFTERDAELLEDYVQGEANIETCDYDSDNVLYPDEFSGEEIYPKRWIGPNGAVSHMITSGPSYTVRPGDNIELGFSAERVEPAGETGDEISLEAGIVSAENFETDTVSFQEDRTLLETEENLALNQEVTLGETTFNTEDLASGAYYAVLAREHEGDMKPAAKKKFNIPETWAESDLIQSCSWNRDNEQTPSRVSIGDSSYNSLKVIWRAEGEVLATEYTMPGQELRVIPDTGVLPPGDYSLELAVRTDDRIDGDPDMELAETDCGTFTVNEDGTRETQQALSVSENEVEQGSQVTVNVQVDSPGHILEIKNPSGETVERFSVTQNGDFRFSVSDDATPGEYTSVLRRDRSGNPFGSVMNFITGATAREAFTVVENQVTWKQNCQENNYSTESIEGQITCIQEEIIPSCFQSPTAENCQRIGQSLCQDLLNYNYDGEELVCAQVE